MNNLNKVIINMIENMPIPAIFGELKINTNGIELVSVKGYSVLINGLVKDYNLSEEEFLKDFIKTINYNLNKDGCKNKLCNQNFICYISKASQWFKITIQTICDSYFIIYFYPTYEGYNDTENILEYNKKIALEFDHKKILDVVSDSIPDHIFYRDLEGRYMDVNRSFLQDTKLLKEDVIGKTNYDLEIFKDISDNFKESDDKILESKKSEVFHEVIYFGNDLRHIETIKAPCFDSENRILGIVGISRDITDRILKEVEEERIKADFFANLSHELRTPLNLIFSCLQMIDLKIKDNDDIKSLCGSYLDIIKQNSKRSLRLINNFIDSNRLNNGYLELNAQNGDIVQFIENICDSVSEFIHQKELTMIFDTYIEECIISFDMEKIERVMLNLISNAIKYNKPNGRIDVILQLNQNVFEIKVKDTGIGIPKEKQDEIFKRFKQIDNRLTKHSEGSGIGLSLTKSLIEIHNGNISVNSKIGLGTEFIVKLPYTKECLNTKKVLKINDKLINTNELVERMSIEFSDIY
ncbi:PAS domain-containing sensor histidine kinase [Romboutsia lituseburensis]|uniref:sensor histidine kinase n=1 Tax=Romboutsia lituseburensis TaxID=1537 RepID=UPI00215AA2D0|nr:PAS domain-containing sensor histidine kinase [Romboutsia lituseburensis]MCR8744156.1 PAS domain-containing sensor histidine kinase [Romboutsia lituseburensis]